MNSRTSMVVLAHAMLAGDQQLRSQSTNYNGFDLADKAGNIRKPSDYRDRFQVLGTYDVRDPKGDQMHVTYASPGAAEYYRKTGKFADGVVLVKEIYSTDHAELTTGDAYWAKGVSVWFVMIKDTKGPAKANDWVYIRGYPVLASAK